MGELCPLQLSSFFYSATTYHEANAGAYTRVAAVYPIELHELPFCRITVVELFYANLSLPII